MIFFSIPVVLLMFYLIRRIRLKHQNERAFMQRRREHKMTTLIESLREDGNPDAKDNGNS